MRNLLVQFGKWTPLRCWVCVSLLYALGFSFLWFHSGSVGSALQFSCFSGHDGKYLYRVAMNLEQGKADPLPSMLYWYERFGLPVLANGTGKILEVLASRIPGVPQTFEAPLHGTLPIHFLWLAVAFIVLECIFCGLAAGEFLFLLKREGWSERMVQLGSVLFALSPVLWFGALNSLDYPLTLAGTLFLYNRRKTLGIWLQLLLICMLCMVRQTNVILVIFPVFAALLDARRSTPAKLMLAAVSGLLPLILMAIAVGWVTSRFHLSVSEVKGVGSFAFSWPFLGLVQASLDNLRLLFGQDGRAHLIHLGFMVFLPISLYGWWIQIRRGMADPFAPVFFWPFALMMILLNHIGYISFFHWSRIWFQIPPVLVGLFLPFWWSPRLTRLWGMGLILIFLILDIHVARFQGATSQKDEIRNIQFLCDK